MKKIYSVLTLMLCLLVCGVAKAETIDDAKVIDGTMSFDFTTTGHATAKQAVVDDYIYVSTSTYSISGYQLKNGYKDGNSRYIAFKLGINAVINITTYIPSSERNVYLTDGKNTIATGQNAQIDGTTGDLTIADITKLASYNKTDKYAIVYLQASSDLYVQKIDITEKTSVNTDASLKSVVINGEKVAENDGVYAAEVAKKDFEIVVTPNDNTATVSYSVDGGTAKSACSFKATDLKVGQVINVVSTITAEDGTTTTTQNIKVTIIKEAIASVEVNGTAISAEDLASLISTKSVEINSLVLTREPQVVAITNADAKVNATKLGDDYTITFDGENYTVIVDPNSVVLPAGRPYNLEGKEKEGGTLSSDKLTVTYTTTNNKYGQFEIKCVGSNASSIGQQKGLDGGGNYALKLGTGRDYEITNSDPNLTIVGVGVTGYMNLGSPTEFNLTSSNASATVITPTNHSFTSGSNKTEDLQTVNFVINGAEADDVLTLKVGAQGMMKFTLYYTYSQKVTFGEEGWVSFAPTAAAMIPDDANLEAAYYVSDQDGTVATLTEIEKGSAVKNYTGIILKGTPNSTITFESVLDSEATEIKDNLLVGTETEKDLSKESGTIYVLGVEDTTGEVGLFKYVGTDKIAANKAYMPVSTTAAPARFISFEGATSSIHNIIVEQFENDAIYNINGQRVNANYKGIVIKNGKKMLVK